MRFSALAACVLLLTARPCRAETEFQAALLLEWRAALDAYDSTREHARFLKEGQTPFRFAPVGVEMPDWAMAIYEDGGLVINGDHMEAAAASLKKQGVPEEVLPSVTALKTLHIIAHELRHGMNERLRTSKSIYWKLSSVEEELIAYVDSVRTLRELQSKKSYLKNFQLKDADGRTVLEAAAKGLKGLEAWVRRDPWIQSVLTTESSEWGKELESYAATQRENLDYMAKFKAMRGGAAPDFRKLIDAQLAKYDPEDSYLRREALYREGAAVARDLAQFERIREFYREQLAELSL